MRIIQEMFYTDEVKGEWEDSTRVDTRYLSEREVAAWVREANKRAKTEMEFVRFRSIERDDSY
jgi:hypothetical protein